MSEVIEVSDVQDTVSPAASLCLDSTVRTGVSLSGHAAVDL